MTGREESTRERAYQPYLPAGRHGGPPPGDEKPPYRVLVHRQYEELWDQLAERVGLESAQQFYDHVAWTPGEAPKVNRATLLRGKAGKAVDGFSRVIHYEITGAGRINYRFHNAYDKGTYGDAHKIVQILTIDLGSH